MTEIHQLRDELSELADRMTGVEINVARIATSVETLVSDERTNRTAIYGNGAPGLKADVAVLKADVSELKDNCRWGWRTVAGEVIRPVVTAVLFFIAFMLWKGLG